MSAVLDFSNVFFIRNGQHILSDVTWQLHSGQRWVILGGNGSGKTTLLKLAALYEHPSRGTVSFLDQLVGTFDVRLARKQISMVSPAIAKMIRLTLTAHDIVLSAQNAALEPWWHEYTTADHERADWALDQQQLGPLRNHSFASLSSGERQRLMLARTLMMDPVAMLFDEPTSGLDLKWRELFLDGLDELHESRPETPSVTVTHHVEEIPRTTTHVLLLQDGKVLAQGPIQSTLSSASLSECFDVDVQLHCLASGRYAVERTQS